MITLRRPQLEPRIEIMPLIDVIFLLLTFFIYAMVLMVHIELTPLRLQAYESAERATPQPAISIAIDLDGQILLNRDPVAVSDLLPALEQARAGQPDAAIYLALEDGEAEIDRAPILTSIFDQLRNEGIDINLVGRPTQ